MPRSTRECGIEPSIAVFDLRPEGLADHGEHLHLAREMPTCRHGGSVDGDASPARSGGLGHSGRRHTVPPGHPAGDQHSRDDGE